VKGIGQSEERLLELWEVKKGRGGDLEYLKEGNGMELMVSVIHNYLCSFSMATASNYESITIILW